MECKSGNGMYHATGKFVKCVQKQNDDKIIEEFKAKHRSSGTTGTRGSNCSCQCMSEPIQCNNSKYKAKCDCVNCIGVWKCVRK